MENAQTENSAASGASALTDVLERYAKVGDKICCDFHFPWPHTKTLSLDTPEAAAYANELFDQENCAWRLKRSNV